MAEADNNFGVRVALDEATRYFNRQHDHYNGMKDTVKTIFGAANLVVALISATQVLQYEPGMVDGLRLWLVLAMVLLYVVMIGLCLVGMSPLVMYGPTLVDWDTYEDAYFHKETERDVLKQQLVGYLNAIQLNNGVLGRRRWVVNVLFGIFALEVVVVGALALLG